MKHQYVTISPENAFFIINEFQKNNRKIDIKEYEVIKGDGELYPQDEIEALSHRITREVSNKSQVPSRLEKGLVENPGAQWLHQTMTEDKGAFSDPEFWLWLTVKYFSEFVEWRYKKGEKPAAISHYGLGSQSSTMVKENLLYSMWIRAKSGFDDTLPDPYIYVTKNDSVDLYTSFIARPLWAATKSVATTFIRRRFEDNLTTNQYRALGSSINASSSNLALYVFDQKKVGALISHKLILIKKNIDPKNV